MQDLFIEFLPPWVETGLQPAFYDMESGTVLQQTARMYAKVNELVKAVNGMDKIIKEYVEYIDNYFKNLDVQEEINNKLDEMAEGGQLQAIIAQFLEAAPVFGYDTIEDMSEASNLNNGCIAHVLGNTVANAGDGAYYTIRTRTESDDPDGFYLVAIGNNLVGERVLDDLQRQLNTLPVKDDSEVALYCFFDKTDNNKINFFTSEDGVNLKKLITSDNIGNTETRDPSLMYHNGKFYLATTGYDTDYDFTVRVSEDLKTWQTYHVDLGLYDATYTYRWAPEWFVDDNDKIYIVISKQYANTEGWGDFRPYIAECTDIDTLTFDTPQRMILNDATSDNHIDGVINKYNGIYQLFIKSEHQTELYIEYYTSLDLINWTLQSADPCKFGRGVEGPMIFTMNGQTFIAAERYKNAPLGKSYYVISKTSDYINYTNNCDVAYPDIGLSHGGVCVLEKKKFNNLISNGKIELQDNNKELNFTNDIKKFDLASTQLTDDDTNTGTRLGKYLHMFDVKCEASWRTNYIQFHVAAGLDQSLEGDYCLMVFIENNSVSRVNIQETYCRIRNSDYRASAAGKMLAVKDASNPMLVHVYLDVETAIYNPNAPVSIDFINKQMWLSNIIKFTDRFVDSVNTSSNVFSWTNGSYTSRSITINNAENTKARIVFACYNGTIDVKGHINGVTDATRMDGAIQINNYNGMFNYINLNPNLSSDGQAITFTKESYDATKLEYTVLVEHIPQYSAIEIRLPNNELSYIKSVSYPD